MFNHNLTAFVYAIDCGSFTKAAEKLFVTPTAVMKQINSLESHRDLKLIERTSQGGTRRCQHPGKMGIHFFLWTAVCA